MKAIKKLKIAILLLIFAISFFNSVSLTAFAGMPPYVPIYEMVLIDSNDNLVINSQTLTIAPPAEITEPFSPYTPNMPDRLSTVYEIENKAAAVLSRVALIHFGNVYDDLSAYKLNANGSVVSPMVYYKNLSAMFDNTENYADILSDAFYEPVVYDDSLCFTEYVFTTAPMVSINFTLEENQKIIYSANSSSITSGVNIKTSGSFASSSGVVSLLVTNGELNYSCDADFELETSVISYNELLAEADYPISENSPLTSYLFASNALNSFLLGYNDILSFGDLFAQFPRCIILVYEINFVSGFNALSVDRPIKYTYDYGYEPPLFALHIKAAPLKTWAQIKTTTINIATPPDLPYIIDDDLAFEKTAENNYTFSGNVTAFDEYYIVFCSAENPIKNNPPSWWTPLRIALVSVGGVAVVVLVVSLVLLVRDKKRRSA